MAWPNFTTRVLFSLSTLRKTSGWGMSRPYTSKFPLQSVLSCIAVVQHQYSQRPIGTKKEPIVYYLTISTEVLPVQTNIFRCNTLIVSFPASVNIMCTVAVLPNDKHEKYSKFGIICSHRDQKHGKRAYLNGRAYPRFLAIENKPT